MVGIKMMEEIGEKTFEFYDSTGKKLKITCMVYRDEKGKEWMNFIDVFKVIEVE